MILLLHGVICATSWFPGGGGHGQGEKGNWDVCSLNQGQVQSRLQPLHKGALPAPFLVHGGSRIQHTVSLQLTPQHSSQKLISFFQFSYSYFKREKEIQLPSFTFSYEGYVPDDFWLYIYIKNHIYSQRPLTKVHCFKPPFTCKYAYFRKITNFYTWQIIWNYLPLLIY